MPPKARYAAEKAAGKQTSKAKRKRPARVPVCVEIQVSNAALVAKRVLRTCLGRGSGGRRGPGKEHTFWSTGPDNRICPECRNRSDALRLSPTMLEPMTCHTA